MKSETSLSNRVFLVVVVMVLLVSATKEVFPEDVIVPEGEALLQSAGNAAPACVDTPGWVNGAGHGCASYTTQGWCANGKVKPGQQWTIGQKFNYPEENCCVCGIPFTPIQPGSKGILDDSKLGRVIDWAAAQAEKSIPKDFCYRSVGTPLQCAPGLDNDASLCYPPCRDGYSGGGPLCKQNCRAGYTDYPLTCTDWSRLSTYTKHTYGRGVGRVIDSCPPDKERIGALCFYPCLFSLQSCGPATCVKDGNCAKVVSDMVLAPITMTMSLAGFVTGGASTAAVKAISTTTKVAIKTLTTTLKALKTVKKTYETADGLKGGIETAMKLNFQKAADDFIKAAGDDFGALTDPMIDKVLNSVYPKDSAVYLQITRGYAARLVKSMVADAKLDLLTDVVAMVDPTGIYGVIKAYKADMCGTTVNPPPAFGLI